MLLTYILWDKYVISEVMICNGENDYEDEGWL